MAQASAATLPTPAEWPECPPRGVPAATFARSRRPHPHDSGAWAGEIAFLNSYWEKEQGRAQTTKDVAFYSIVVKEDSEVYSWSHGDMEKLMESSADMRSALTRAMSLAVVGKVVNLTVSRSYQSSPWSVWLKDWSVGGDKDKTSVEVRNVQEMKLAEDQ